MVAVQRDLVLFATVACYSIAPPYSAAWMGHRWALFPRQRAATELRKKVAFQGVANQEVGLWVV